MIVSVDVLPVFAPAVRVMGPLLVSVIAGVVDAVTVTVLVVVALIELFVESAPVMVTTYVPAVVLAVDPTERVAVGAVVPMIVTEPGATAQVTGLAAPAGAVVTAHDKPTVPA